MTDTPLWQAMHLALKDLGREGEYQILDAAYNDDGACATLKAGDVTHSVCIEGDYRGQRLTFAVDAFKERLRRLKLA